MLILKILGPLLILTLTLIQFYLDHKYSDRRTKKYRRFRIIFLCVIVITSMITSYIIYKEHASSNELLDQVKSLQSIIIEQNKSEKKGRKDLENTILSLRDDLRPFLDLATKTYPYLEPDSALQKLTMEILNLKEKTIYLEQSKDFKPLEESIKKMFISELKDFNSKFGYIKYVISVYEGNRFRRSIGNQLIEIFRLAEIGKSEMRSESILRFGSAVGLKIIYYGLERNTCDLFFKILSKYYFIDKPDYGNNAKIDATIDLSGKPGIAIYLIGDPIFETDGRIRF